MSRLESSCPRVESRRRDSLFSRAREPVVESSSSDIESRMRSFGVKRVLAFSLGVVFVLLSAFHVIGAFGAWDQLPVIPEVPGEVVHRPSGPSWLFIAGALGLAALVVAVRGDVISTPLPSKLSTLACLVLAAVFIARTIGEFRFFGFFRTIEGTDFAFWDTWLYTPLCLAIGLGALWLASTTRSREAPIDPDKPESGVQTRPSTAPRRPTQR